MKQMSFMTACRDYFGMKPGQTLADFMKEVKALTDKDRADFKAWFSSVGYEITAG